jgi:hypothetical protein
MQTVMRQLRPSFASSAVPTASTAAAVNSALALILAGLLAAVYAPTFGVDAADDVFFSQARHGTYDLALASYVNGRFVPGAIFQILAASGIEIHRIWTALQFLAVASVAAFSVTFVTRLSLPLSRLETFAFSGLIAVFPYAINLIANKNNAINATLAYAAAGGAIYFHSRLKGWGRVAVPACFMFVCVSSYQTTVYYFVVFVIGLQMFCDADRRQTLLALASGAAACAAAFAAYLLAYWSIVDWALLEMAYGDNPELATFYGNPRSLPNDLYGFMEAVLLYVFSVARSLFAPEPILPVALKILAIATFLASYRRWNECAISEMHAPSEAFALRTRRFLVLALVCALGSPIHLAIANKWLAPRVVAHAGAVWAVLLLAALVFGPAKWRRRIFLSVAVLLSGISVCTYTVVRDGQRLNERDRTLAREIVADLQRNPQFDPNLPIAVIGLLDAKSSYMAHTWSYYNLNTSKFGNEWSKRAALEAAAGRKLTLPDAAFLRSASNLCASAKPDRPHYSTITTKRGAVVCLE